MAGKLRKPDLTSEWIRLVDAMAILGIGRKHMSKLVRNGVLTQRHVPGGLVFCLRSECVKLLKSSITRAKSSDVATEATTAARR